MIWGVKLVIFVLSVVIAVGQCEQRFLETPVGYQEVSSGEDVILSCRVENKRGQCIWQKDGKPIGIHPDKYEWATIRSNSVSDADCSLLIKRASLDFDDGYWECQVSPGDFTRQDALTSLPSRLLVRVKPRKPRLEHGGAILMESLTLKEAQEVTISCVSRYGNPPAIIKWFIGGDEVEPLREQTNATEVDSPKTWAAHSLLRIRGQRENHGMPIRCLSLHSSGPLPAIAESRLDIHYSPEVRIETSPRVLSSSLEDSSSFMSIKCLADANPPATVRWYKDMANLSKSNIVEPITNNSTLSPGANASLSGSEVRFEPVKREDAGLYSCRAFNNIGESSPANYRLDVQYSPRLKINGKLNETRSEVEAIALLASEVEAFECDEFEANPPARYRWLHVRGSLSGPVDNGIDHKSGTNDGRVLRMRNVVWSDEGEYRCVAFNLINGVRREMTSETRFLLHISGPPEIQTTDSDKITEKGMFESLGWAGESSHRLVVRFCSRPPPKLVAWQWGSSHIRAGEIIEPKYEALPLEPILENSEVTNCYWAKLEIRDLQKEDSRVYTLLVESEKGRDSISLGLTVRDPTEIKIIAIASGVGLLLVIAIIALVIYLFLRARHRRYCKDQEDDDEEEGSIAADAFYVTPNSMSRSQKSQVYSRKHSDGGLAVMYDYNQIVKQTGTISPEALKVRRAPVVLQAPTIV
ncbi:hemicentin-1 [Fopius arisanus]|nr:PREDICTED: hemicentin-1-like [Fopius arisanus]XP_011299989.1 PREDICTED: hemicentin-1-like [Fopius arisanus]XP_011299991.1 PREDICTED: hemicentin-1-like [Fopius arisanus]